MRCDHSACVSWHACPSQRQGGTVSVRDSGNTGRSKLVRCCVDGASSLCFGPVVRRRGKKEREHRKTKTRSDTRACACVLGRQIGLKRAWMQLDTKEENELTLTHSAYTNLTQTYVKIRTTGQTEDPPPPPPPPAKRKGQSTLPSTVPTSNSQMIKMNVRLRPSAD